MALGGLGFIFEGCFFIAAPWPLRDLPKALTLSLGRHGHLPKLWGTINNGGLRQKHVSAPSVRHLHNRSGRTADPLEADSRNCSQGPWATFLLWELTRSGPVQPSDAPVEEETLPLYFCVATGAKMCHRDKSMRTPVWGLQRQNTGPNAAASPDRRP